MDERRDDHRGEHLAHIKALLPGQLPETVHWAPQQVDCNVELAVDADAQPAWALELGPVAEEEEPPEIQHPACNAEDSSGTVEVSDVCRDPMASTGLPSPGGLSGPSECSFQEEQALKSASSDSNALEIEHTATAETSGTVTNSSNHCNDLAATASATDPPCHQDSVSEDQQQKRPIHTFSDGKTYLGDWLGSKRHGHGVQVWPDGAKFEGQWVEDVADGEGRFIHADGAVYKGQWRGDQAHGEGTYTHADGLKYVGQWECDKQHGDGLETRPDGAQYSGRYERGQNHGYGEFTSTNGSKYKGEFNENDIHGVGTYHWHDGRLYTGQWVNNRMHGQGVFHWPDGRTYSGHYANDQEEGIGIFSWPDGRTWQGQWGAGKQEGTGIYTTAEGVRKGGVWNSGRREQWLDELPEISSGRDVVLTLNVTPLDLEGNVANVLSPDSVATSLQGSIMNVTCNSMGGEEVIILSLNVEKETLLDLRKMIAMKLSVHWVYIKLVFADQGILPASSDQKVLAAVLNLPCCVRS